MTAALASDIRSALSRVRDLISQAERDADVEVVNLLLDAEWALKDAEAMVNEAVS